MIVPFFISHQGCHHCCVFCDQRTISGSRGELPSEEEILATIEEWRASSPKEPVEVAFFGGTFTSLPFEDQERLLLPLQPLLESGVVSSVRVSTRPDAVNEAIIRFLRDRGVTTVELGVQSLDDRVLELSGRGHTAGASRNACCLLADAGMRFGIQLMPGLPGSSREADLASLEEAIASAPSFLRIYPAVVISGTGLERMYLRGEYRPLQLSEAVELCAAMLLKAMRHGVQVIRIGLQATDSISSEGTVVAGPYHPAFRQLVESELCYGILSRLVTGLEKGANVRVRCTPSRVSDVIGQLRANLARIEDATGITIEKVVPDTGLSPEELVVETAAGERRGNLLHNVERELYV